ncbi:MAG TPA: hypothetical protein VLG76_04950 [Rhabdochlamydiaceae bacterium]|nr:hypothetical protein [Rhabdochlamydiaceae bacterium]
MAIKPIHTESRLEQRRPSSIVTTRSYVVDMALAPAQFTLSAAKTARAFFTHDEEGVIDGAGKVASALDLLISGTSAVFRAIIYLGIWLGRDLISGLPQVYKFVLLPYAIIGLVLSFFELAYEVVSLYRGISLRSKLKFSNDTDVIGNREVIRNEFFEVNEDEKAQINKFLLQRHPGDNNLLVRLQIYSSLEKKILENKFQNLARRISMSAAEEVKQIINSKELEDLRVLTKIVDVQTRKMLQTHTVGLFAIILSAVCYAFLLVASPYVIYISIGIAVVSLILILIYYALEKGYFNRPGYTFSFKACLPDCVKKIFNCDTVAASTHYSLSSREIRLMDTKVHQVANHHYRDTTCPHLAPASSQ